MKGPLDQLAERLDQGADRRRPEVGSFEAFLREHAMVHPPGRPFQRYSFEGREALLAIVRVFDLIMGNIDGRVRKDAGADVCGGAQFGKTILALLFGVYVTAILGRNWGYYLPDDDLVEGIVDTKLRPDVVEPITWLAPMMTLGASETAKGKRVVNRKGAFQMSDGTHSAFGMVRGMGKIPTSFSMDVAMEDEKDDIPAKRSKFLTGRMSAGDLRFRSSIGTQRYHGAGQQKQWQDGSQGVFEFEVEDESAPCLEMAIDGFGVETRTKRRISLEETWPQCCRMAVDGAPKASDPKLTLRGDFEDAAGRRWGHDPQAAYYLADPETGFPVDRRRPIEHHRAPERMRMHAWSWRVPQLAIGAIDLQQIVRRWQDAVRDPDMMVVFACDVLGLPQNTEQRITPEVLMRSRSAGAPHDLALTVRDGCRGYAGLDTGNRCWLVAREVESESTKRIVWAEDIPLGDVVRRAEAIFRLMGLTALFIDARPAVDEARTLCYRLNGLADIRWPVVDNPETAYIAFPGGLVWNGPRSRWEGLRCAVVEFARKEGGGIVQKIGADPRAGETRYFPIIQCNRFESIDRAVGEFLTPKENVIRVVDGRLLDEPVMRLPRLVPGSPAIVETLDRHLLTGAKREEKDGETGDYVDKCDNHLLLADAYSGLAEMVAGSARREAPVEYEAVESERRGRRYAG